MTQRKDATTHRSNIQDVAGGVELCRGDHDKDEPCEWEFYATAEILGELAEAAYELSTLAGVLFMGETMPPPRDFLELLRKRIERVQELTPGHSSGMKVDPSALDAWIAHQPADAGEAFALVSSGGTS